VFVVTSHATLGDTGKPTGAWYSEIAAPYYVFQDAGCSVTLASVAGGPAVIDPASRLPEWQTDATRRLDADGQAVAALAKTRPVSAVDPSGIDILYMPGGLGAMWDFPHSPALQALVESCAGSGKQIVATLCHGAACLVAALDRSGAPLVAGRMLTSFTNSEERALQTDRIVPFLLESRLCELGARFQAGPDWSDTAFADGWLISGQNPASAAHVAQLALKAFSEL
jgi:putative intracellular protease/amidase